MALGRYQHHQRVRFGMPEKKPLTIIVGKLKKPVEEILKRLIAIGRRKPKETERKRKAHPPGEPPEN